LRSKKLVWLLVCMMLAFVVASCTPAPPPDPPKPPDDPGKPDLSGGTVVFALWSAPEGIFNVNLYQSRYDADSMGPIFDGLLGNNPDLSFYPNLAESYKISDNGLVFSYKLREGLKWHDGKPVTTADVKFTFEWMCHPDYTGVRAGYWKSIEGFEAYNKGEAQEVTGIKVLNAREIEFHFTEVDAPGFQNVSTWAISPKHVFEGTAIADLEKHPAIKSPIGTGPFKFVKYVPGAYLEMERNDNYHLGKPLLDKIIVKVANPDAAQVELITGGVTAAWVQPNKRDFDLYKKEGLAITEYPQNGYQYMGLWLKEGFFADKAVRQAVTYAIDRFSIVKNLLDDMGIVQVVPMSSVSWGYDKDLKPYPFDPAKAKELLEGAGWKVGSDNFRYKDGKKAQFTLSYPTGNPVRMESALVIQQNLKDVGIDVVLDIMEFSALSNLVYTEKNFDAYLMGWGLGADPDASPIWGKASAWSPFHFGFDHPDNERLLNEGRAVVPQEERKPIYKAWQELLYEEAPYVWLYAGNEAYVYNAKLKEFKPNPFGIWFDVEKWYFAK
jgi:peptide/nickel transport system substrate-binding protein